MFQPWLAHFYPGVTLDQLYEGQWTVSGFVGMRDYIRGQESGG